jgi:hypothetical protein
MRRTLIGIPSRITFVACGTGCLALSELYLHASLPLFAFATALILVGSFAVLIALLPGSWVAKGFRLESTELSLVPIKTMGAFAGVSYIVTVALFIIPNKLVPHPLFLLSVCPACALIAVAHPSLRGVLLFLAPMSAVAWGSLGGGLGYLSVLFTRNR